MPKSNRAYKSAKRSKELERLRRREEKRRRRQAGNKPAPDAGSESPSGNETPDSELPSS